ncbi:MAG: hypothetical protein COV30_01430 [Candidatus Yanofskybacteria bacterium CG10_big_fil_rev_8_21_14_0_10_37_15]|uniref:Phosphatidylglycerol lysyltransferase C-terminal domain-containing protein n=1 Tax=Candidatus Yanofskybacteria bacterium CG10_big_fil_rev_8_21_14_0_10_37_15 TaxID=1975097 RepID=A0A2H0R7P0_9BACT|nr:MAG: hypothetical protein COV30_01430 [Candidatus Yanofskybacteria bacterium CG10_big_fil_rev_8_21_14_0_10_37_15]
MKLYDNIEAERDRIEACIKKYGWTSDHNIDWFVDSVITSEGKPIFVEFDDGSGLLTHKYLNEWRIWSDPLSDQNIAVEKIFEFSKFVLGEDIKDVWCDDVSSKIWISLQKKNDLTICDVFYSLFWPLLDMKKYDPTLSGHQFKDIRNAKNKFYREHKINVVDFFEIKKEKLYKIFDDWAEIVSKKQGKEYVYDLRYHNIVKDGFRGFVTARVLVVDDVPVGVNAGYCVPNKINRFAGVIGIHNYSLKDLGTILWLEDLEWIKNAGYEELDMQGDEEGGGLKFKMRFGSSIDRKTDTFCIKIKNKE